MTDRCKDIFALQDEIVQKIVTTLKLQLTLREQGYLVRKTTDNLEAYDTFLRGIEAFNRYTQEANAQARQLFEQAIELDPQYAEAYAGLSRTFSVDWIYQWSQDPQTLERAFVLAQQAVALDDFLCLSPWHWRMPISGKSSMSRPLLQPSGPSPLTLMRLRAWALGLILNFAGRPEEAIELIEKAMRLNPRYPSNYYLASAWPIAWRGGMRKRSQP